MVSKPADIFRKEQVRIESLRVAAESACNSGLLTNQNLEVVYEAGFLALFVAVENFVEDLFIDTMIGKHVPKGCRFNRRIEVISKSTARELLYDGRSYVDLFPYDHLKRKSKIYFTGGRPFSLLEKTDIKEIEFFHKMRNLIAHKSRGSHRSFSDLLDGRAVLPPSKRTAARYLRSTFAVNVNRFQQDSASLLLISSRLSS